MPAEANVQDEAEDSDFLAVVAVCAVVVGGLAAFAASNLGVIAAVAVGVVVAASTGYYLREKQPVEEVAGTTLRLVGVVVLLMPFVLYISNITVGGEDIQLVSDISISGADSENIFALDGMGLGLTSIDSILSFLFWVMVCVAGAGVLFFAGRKVKPDDGR